MAVNYVGNVTITEEDIRRAETYLPIMDKTAIVQVMAPACMEKVRIAVPVGGDGENIEPTLIPVPDIDQESALERTLCSTFVLLYFYLKMPDITSQYDPNGEMKLAANDYDRYRHIMTQLERMKASCKDTEVRNKIFELLADYKDFERRLGLEIHNLLNIRNDLCSRMTAMFTQQTDPKTIENALKQADALAHRTTELQNKVTQEAVELAVKGAKRKALEKRMNETAMEKFGGKA